MITANEIVYNIRNAPAGGRSNRDRGFSNRQLLFAFRACRNKLLIARYFTQSGKQRPDINPQYQQDMGVVPLIDCDITDNQRIKWNVPVKKVVIPKVVDLPRNKGIAFFGRIDKITPIYLPDVSMGFLDNHVQYKQRNGILAEQIGDTIYLRPQTEQDIQDVPCFVNIRVIADKPEEVPYYNEDGTLTCFDWDKTPYPIDTMIEQDCYDMVWQEYIFINAKIPDDNANDEIKGTLT